MARVKVGVLGATGLIGQRLVQLLYDHPWFELSVLSASERSVNKRYGDAVRWRLPFDIPTSASDMRIAPVGTSLDCAVLFSALPADVARDVEPEMAQAGYLVSSNASAYRRETDVPLVIPEVNPEHLDLLHVQRARRGWRGAIVTNPNCSAITLVLALKPLVNAFGVKRVLLSTMQALSGAGYPGHPALDLLDNVIPYIGGEEEKLEWEPLKILGHLRGDNIIPATITISASCHRVPVWDGHTEAVSVELAAPATEDEIVHALRGFRGLPQELELPTAPRRPLVVRDEPDRPQPRLDRETERGMAVVIGRVRPCPLLGWKFVALAHNTLRGAAGAAALNAELLRARGFLH